MVETLRKHCGIAILLAISGVFLFSNLGTDYLWEDEGDTAALAVNILKFGVPKAWDGSAFLDSDHGARLNQDLVMVTHPWVQYYVTAGSFAVLGQTTFAARIPFALAGWTSVVFVYFFLWRVTRNRLIAFSAAALLTFSVQFLLYARQCRYCALNMLLVVWLFWAFFKMKSARQCLSFVIAAVLLFHSHPYGLAPVVALGGLSLIYHPFREQRRWILFAAPAVAVLTLPWLALSSLSSSGSELNTTAPASFGEVIERAIQATIETTSVTPLIGTAILLIAGAFWLRLERPRSVATPTTENAVTATPSTRLLETNETSILVGVLATAAVYGFGTVITQSSDSLWLAGMRYASAVLPLGAMAAGIAVVKASRGKIIIWAGLMLLFAFTKLAQLTPWVSWNPTGFIHFGKYSVGAHVPAKVADRFFGSGLFIFVGDLWRENPGTVEKTCKFLQQNAKPDDVVIVNYGMEPTYFYTRLPQAMGILQTYPVYQRAREMGLPDFVFGVDHARWVVWRSAWETGPGYAINDVLKDLVERGGQITTVLEVDETVWENREDIHFHRFADGTYLFPRTQTFPKSRVARVDWPGG